MTDTEHVYRHPTDGAIIVTPAYRLSSGHLVTGCVWCWTCGTREDVPESWYEREKSLREAITQEWEQNVRPRLPGTFWTEPLAVLIDEYAEHRGWRKPDSDDRYSVFRFIDGLETEAPAH